MDVEEKKEEKKEEESTEPPSSTPKVVQGVRFVPPDRSSRSSKVSGSLNQRIMLFVCAATKFSKEWTPQTAVLTWACTTAPSSLLFKSFFGMCRASIKKKRKLKQPPWRFVYFLMLRLPILLNFLHFRSSRSLISTVLWFKREMRAKGTLVDIRPNRCLTRNFSNTYWNLLPSINDLLASLIIWVSVAFALLWILLSLFLRIPFSVRFAFLKV